MGRPTTLLARPIHLRRIRRTVIFLVVDDYLRDVVNERNCVRFRNAMGTKDVFTLDVYYRVLFSSWPLRLDVVLKVNVLPFPGWFSGHEEERKALQASREPTDHDAEHRTSTTRKGLWQRQWHHKPEASNKGRGRIRTHRLCGFDRGTKRGGERSAGKGSDQDASVRWGFMNCGCSCSHKRVPRASRVETGHTHSIVPLITTFSGMYSPPECQDGGC
ncbi:uncharacterized protein B0H18DRAFT_1008705 [Fomitopsis serialis]|uniref:uncharacterized protein n=1 Tax=Fomitopsis serialis TaxID=139415 RepID=UPI002008E24D|nr:uncharacterized protein B0H18DRAFT_1008705 [Neoantrodia serialis]KAH9925492.1 hypothetical protein B0H18DRAFT_1008705 [Neoantrodia serialis]